MADMFNAQEIFKIAEQIERNGAAFYEKAAERFEGEHRRQLLALSAMERNHEQQFGALLKELFNKPEERLEIFDQDNLVGQYLAAYAQGRIFDLDADPLAALGPQPSLADILRLALEMEKESVVFYTGIQRAVPEQYGKDKIDRIIDEEINHIRLLSEARRELER